MPGLWTMVANDLRQRIRDKSVVIFSLIVPLALVASADDADPLDAWLLRRSLNRAL